MSDTPLGRQLSLPPDLDARVRSLPDVQLRLLRLAYHRNSTKEMMALTGLSEGTVKSYCSRAAQSLGARSRRDAAEMVHEWDLAQGASEGGSTFEGIASVLTVPAAGEPAVPIWARLLPFRYKDAPGNDLSILARLFWIPLLAVGIAIGFGAVANAVHVVSDLARDIGRSGR